MLDYGTRNYSSHDLASVGTTIYQRASKNLELAFSSLYAQKCPAGFDSYPPEAATPPTTNFDVAAKYGLDEQTVLRAKINAASQFVLAMTHAINPGYTLLTWNREIDAQFYIIIWNLEGLKLTLSGAINMRDLCDGSHKLGLGIEYTKV